MIRSCPTILKSPLLVVVAASVFSHASVAYTLNLNYTATSDGTSTIHTVVDPVLNMPAATSVSTYTHTLPSLVYTIPGTSYEFYDDYVFTIGGSQVSSITATIDLGSVFNIDNLNVRLFSYTGSAEQLSNQVTLGTAGQSLIQAWTSPSGTGEVAVIDQSGLAAGTYVLQVRGNVTGVAGGNYVGNLQVTPVPVPAAMPLLLSGLGLLATVFGRRRNKSG